MSLLAKSIDAFNTACDLSVFLSHLGHQLMIRSQKRLWATSFDLSMSPPPPSSFKFLIVLLLGIESEKPYQPILTG